MLKPKTGVFIDDANLYFAQKKANWKVDLKKLKDIINQEVKINIFRYYVAIPAKWDANYINTLTYTKKVKPYATLITKPVKYIKVGNAIIKKGDVDVEIVLDVVRQLKNLDIIIVVSGDSDYLELRRYVLENHKKIIFFGFKHNMAWEIKQGKYLTFDRLRKYLELGKITPGYYPGRLLLSTLYQKSLEKSSLTKP